MSASFPSSWEPYGSSQQSQAIAWRKPATRPANQPTLSDRWKHAQAKVLHPTPLQTLPHPTPSLPNPSPSPKKPKNLDLHSFQQAEHEHRILARYESVRSEVREVASTVKALSVALDASRQQHESANKAIHDDVASLHGAIVIVRDQIRENAKQCPSGESLQETVQRVVRPLIQDMQTISRATEKLHTGYSRIDKDVSYLSNALFDRLTKQFIDDVDDLFSRRILPVLRECVRKGFDDLTDSFAAFMDRMGGRVREPEAFHHQDRVYDRYPSRFENRRHGSDYSHQDLIQRRDGEHFVERSDETRNEISLGEEDPRLDSDNVPPDCRHEFGSRTPEKATDFDVTPRTDLTFAHPDSAQSPCEVRQIDHEAKQRTISPSPAHGGADDRCRTARIWTKLRIRPKRIVKNEPVASNGTIIDLTRTADSELNDEADLFEESQSPSQSRRKCAQERHRKCRTRSRSKYSTSSNSESSCKEENNERSPSEAQDAPKTKARHKFYACRSRSPYFTRSAKRRRRK